MKFKELITPTSKVFATGVYLQAFEVEINGKKQWRWLAVGFEDDTFYDSQTVDLHTYADSFDGLITENNDEDEDESESDDAFFENDL